MEVYSNEEAQALSGKQSDGRSCKICLETDGEMISPCKCTGSIRFIHKRCLKVWLEVSLGGLHSYSCEICHEEVQIDCTFHTVRNQSLCNLGNFPLWAGLAALFLGLAGLSGILDVMLIQLAGAKLNPNTGLLFVAWGCAMLSVIGVIVYLLKRLCCIREIAGWRVVPSMHKEDIEDTAEGRCELKV